MSLRTTSRDPGPGERPRRRGGGARSVELHALADRQWRICDTGAAGGGRVLGFIARADDGNYDVLTVADGGGIDSLTFASLDAVLRHFDRAP